MVLCLLTITRVLIEQAKIKTFFEENNITQIDYEEWIETIAITSEALFWKNGKIFLSITFEV